MRFDVPEVYFDVPKVYNVDDDALALPCNKSLVTPSHTLCFILSETLKVRFDVPKVYFTQE